MKNSEWVQDYMDELVSYLEQDAHEVGREAEVEFLGVLRKKIREAIQDDANAQIVDRFATELADDEWEKR